MYKKVVKFSFKQQKIFWVLLFSFMYLVLVDAMDRSLRVDFLGDCLSDIKKNAIEIFHLKIVNLLILANFFNT